MTSAEAGLLSHLPSGEDTVAARGFSLSSFGGEGGVRRPLLKISLLPCTSPIGRKSAVAW